ncbi:MAG: hypothetical protein AB7V32_11045, partial [Candidatus Berkiella sp.]
SSIVKLIPYTTNAPHQKACNEKLFAQIVTHAFSHRRKTLKNALSGIVPTNLFEELGISPIRRPETLSIAEFVSLSDAMHKTQITP